MMIGAINAVKPYQSVSRIDLQRTAKLYADARQNAKAGQTQQSVANAASAQNAQSAQSAPAIGAPVAQSAERMSPAQKLEQGADPVEMAVRMRIQQPGAEETAAAGTAGQGREVQFGMVGQQEEAPAMKLPGQKDEPTTPIEKELAEQAEKAEEAKEARKAEQAEELKESEEAE